MGGLRGRKEEGDPIKISKERNLSIILDLF